MALDWRIGGPKSVGEGLQLLIARKKYAKAIEVLREQVRGRTPGAQVRLQLADLLVLAGRSEEAVPILISLADEFSADGFVAKAVAILKKVEKIRQGMPEVESRLGSLVRQQRTTVVSLPSPAPAKTRRLPEFGMEELGPETISRMAATRSANDAPPPPPSAPPAGGGPELGMEPLEEVPLPVDRGTPGPARAGLPDAQPAGAAPDGVAPRHEATLEAPPPAQPEGGAGAEPLESLLAGPDESTARSGGRAAEPAVPDPPEADGATDAVSHRLRGALRRFLATLPETPPPVVDSQRPPEAAPPQAEEEKLASAVPEDPPVRVPPLPSPEPATAEAGPQPAPAEAAPAGVAGRIRGVLRRFMGSRRDEPEAPPPPSTSEPPGAAPEAPGDAPVEAGTAAPSPEPPSRDLEASRLAPLRTEAQEERRGLEVAEWEGLRPSPGEEIPEVELELVAPPAEEDLVLELVEETEDEAEILGLEEEIEGEGEIFLEPDPLPHEPAPEAAEPLGAEGAGEPPMTDEAFEAKLLDFIEELCRPADASPLPTLADLASASQGAGGEAQTLLASPLFAGLSEPELLAVVRGLKLLPVEAGDVILTEGEVGDSVFILVTGIVKVFVRNPDGRNYEVSELREGSFFGEVSSLSGRPRNATITAACRCDLLELDRPTLESLGQTHPGIREVLAAYYAERANSPEAAAVRSMPRIDSATQVRAQEILEAHFGERRWDPRMRLRLADALAKAGKFSEAVPILVGLADELASRGLPEKSIALLKKVERMRGQVKEFSLAPLKPRGRTPGGSAAPRPSPGGPRRRPEKTTTFFQDWIVGFVRDSVKRRAAPTSRAPDPPIDRASLMTYGLGLQASPLFQGFSEEDLLALIRGLRLLTAAPGDILVSEGERSEGIFILATGEVKLYIRNPAGRDVPLCVLGEGSFFGEISTLWSRPRSATVVAASRCELLQLDPAGLHGITESHPHVREVLEAYSARRAASAEAASIRSLPARG